MVNLLSQNHLERPFELKFIILNKSSLIEFLINEFILFKVERLALFKGNHPMEGFKFNRVNKNNQVKFQFMGLPIDEIYGYYDQPDQVGLYLLMRIDTKDEMDSFVSDLGIPENVTAEDYIKGDFEIAMWRKGEMEIGILHNYETASKTGKRIVVIHHLKNHDFINWEPL